MTSQKAQKALGHVWFRQDLRLADDPALLATPLEAPVLPLYIDDDGLESMCPLGRRGGGAGDLARGA